MYEFIKKNIYLIILFIITLSIGFLTFLTFIDKGFIELSDQNLQILLVLNIFLLIALFVFIFIEIKSAIKNDIDKDGLKSNKKYITYFGLFTLSVLVSLFVCIYGVRGTMGDSKLSCFCFTGNATNPNAKTKCFIFYL